MNNSITQIETSRLKPHPDNPNRMSKANFARLVRHIERTGRYEPLIVRPYLPQRPQSTQRKNKLKNSANSAVKDSFQIINGHHRFEALKQLGYESCDCVVWDVDDDETNLLLATLNRLCGQDELEAKCALLEKLNSRLKVDELAKLLPQTKMQIQRLIDLRKEKLKIELAGPSMQDFPHPLVFFLTAEQKAIVEDAIERTSSIAESPQLYVGGYRVTSKARRNAQAITAIAMHFIKDQPSSIEYRESEVTDGDENQVRAIRAR